MRWAGSVGLSGGGYVSGLAKLAAACCTSRRCVVVVSQIRVRLGVMLGNPETTAGGYALKVHSAGRLDIRRIESIKEGQEVTGSRVRVKVVKNKMAPPFKQAEFDIMFAQGISKPGELVDLGVEKKVVEKSGAWYSYQGERLGQGRDAVRDFLLSNQPLPREIEGKLRDLAGLPGRTPEKPVVAPVKDEKKTEDKREERRPHKVGV